MDWKIVLLRDAILRALSCDDASTIKEILEESLLKTSDHWQERMVGEGLATDEDFFYDTYLGPPVENVKSQDDPGEGDLIAFSPSAAPDGNWHAVDEKGDSHEISPGTVGIVLEKTEARFENYNYDYQIVIGEKVFNDLSENMFNKKN